KVRTRWFNRAAAGAARPRRAQDWSRMHNLGAAEGTCGSVGALNGARRLLVVLNLIVDLQPVALGVRHDDQTVLRIENHGGGEGEPPFTLQAAHLSTPFHRVRAGR